MSDQGPTPEQAPPPEVTPFVKGCIGFLILVVVLVVGAAIVLGSR